MRSARLLGAVCIAAAVGLGVWAVNLARSLSQHSTAYHLPAVKGAVGAVWVVVLVAAAVLGERHDRRQHRDATSCVCVVMPTAALLVLGAATEWFLVVPGARSLRAADTAFAVLAPVAAVAVVLVGRAAVRPAVRRTVCVLAVVLVAASVVVMVLRSAPTLLGGEQRVVWSGLDLAEAVTVVLVAVSLFRRRSALVPGTCAAVLFVCDAVINVGVARGAALQAAIVMACIEIPAAVLLCLIGLRSTRAWSPAPRRPLSAAH